MCREVFKFVKRYALFVSTRRDREGEVLLTSVCGFSREDSHRDFLRISLRFCEDSFRIPLGFPEDVLRISMIRRDQEGEVLLTSVCGSSINDFHKDSNRISSGFFEDSPRIPLGFPEDFLRISRGFPGDF